MMFLVEKIMILLVDYDFALLNFKIIFVYSFDGI